MSAPKKARAKAKAKAKEEKPSGEKKPRPAAADVLIGLVGRKCRALSRRRQVGLRQHRREDAQGEIPRFQALAGRACTIGITQGRAANSEAVATALATLEAHAIFDVAGTAAYVRSGGARRRDLLAPGRRRGNSH